MSSTQNTTASLINCRGRLLDLSTPKVMGILNITPDSFYDGGKLKTDDDVLKRAEQMLSEGATILDVGGMSSRPGAEIISEQEERKRVMPAIQLLHKNFPETILSVDTWRSAVAKEAVVSGASLVNDISAGSMDESFFTTIAELKVPYILMHMHGNSANMQSEPKYKDVVKEVFDFLKEKLLQLHVLNVHDILIDVGFGFGKTVEHNFSLLKHLNTFHWLGCPLLVGVSRKSMICKALHVNPDHALNGTTALHMLALQQGAKILRVHDVKEASEASQLYSRYGAAV